VEPILDRPRHRPMITSMRRTSRIYALTASAALCALILAGCGSQTATTSSASSTPSSSPAPITLHDSDNGKTINAVVGQQITVQLGGPTVAGSTYWQFATIASGVLTPQGDQVVAAASQSAQPSGGLINPPGMGMGTVSLTVQVAGVGTQAITAHRDSCGEAMMCTPGNGDYKVTINAAS